MAEDELADLRTALLLDARGNLAAAEAWARVALDAAELAREYWDRAGICMDELERLQREAAAVLDGDRTSVSG